MQVDVSRCLCVHAAFQAVDLSIQSVLYKRGFVPTLVSQLTAYARSTKEVAFATQFNKVRDSLRQLFRSCNRNQLRSVILLIGSSHILAKEVYRFHVSECDATIHESDSVTECSRNCSELSTKEGRQLCLALTVDLDLSGLERLPGSVCAHVMVEVSSAALYPPDLFTPYDNFQLPSAGDSIKRRVSIYDISFKHHCVPSTTQQQPPASTDSKWLRLDTILHRLNA